MNKFKILQYLHQQKTLNDALACIQRGFAEEVEDGYQDKMSKWVEYLWFQMNFLNKEVIKQIIEEGMKNNPNRWGHHTIQLAEQILCNKVFEEVVLQETKS